MRNARCISNRFHHQMVQAFPVFQRATLKKTQEGLSMKLSLMAVILLASDFSYIIKLSSNDGNGCVIIYTGTSVSLPYSYNTRQLFSIGVSRLPTLHSSEHSMERQPVGNLPAPFTTARQLLLTLNTTS